MDKDLIAAVTQSVLALVIVIGSGVMLVWSDVPAEALISLPASIIAFYFGSSVERARNVNGNGGSKQ